MSTKLVFLAMLAGSAAAAADKAPANTWSKAAEGRTSRGVLWTLLAAGVVAGCGPEMPATVPVSGRVLLDEKPVEGAAVMLVPEEGSPAHGATDAEGNFSLTTFEPGDGAVPGTYTVVITLNVTDERGEVKSLLPRKYADPRTSGLTVEVAKQGPNEFYFELTSG